MSERWGAILLGVERSDEIAEIEVLDVNYDEGERCVGYVSCTLGCIARALPGGSTTSTPRNRRPPCDLIGTPMTLTYLKKNGEFLRVTVCLFFALIPLVGDGMPRIRIPQSVLKDIGSGDLGSFPPRKYSNRLGFLGSPPGSAIPAVNFGSYWNRIDVYDYVVAGLQAH